jgi:succinate dehydrogenase/fumarate reductase cytochrome b subunit
MKGPSLPYALRWVRGMDIARWAHRLQRWSGLFLTAFAMWHSLQLYRSARDPSLLANHLTLLYNPWFMAAITLVVGFHGLNGLRQLVYEVGILGITSQRRLILVVKVLVLLLAFGVLVWRGG